jgi:hypothetical protein
MPKAIVKRVFRLLALCLGLIGSLACIAAMIGAWYVEARLCRATDRLFEKLGGTVGAVQTRVVRVRERLQDSKVTAEDLAESLKQWTKQEALDRVAMRLDAGKKTEKLTSILQQTDDWLEFSESACGLVEQAMSIAVPADANRLEGFVEELAGLREWLADATETVGRIRDSLTKENDAEKGENGTKPLGPRIEKGVELTLRVAVILGSMDHQLRELTDRLSHAQQYLQESNATALHRIRLATIAVTLFILWLGAGQLALASYGYRSLRRGQTGRASA